MWSHSSAVIIMMMSLVFASGVLFIVNTRHESDILPSTHFSAGVHSALVCRTMSCHRTPDG